MADEAVVRILLDDSGAKSTPSAQTPPQPQVDEALVKALREGSAMPYAPPGQAIPLTPGMDRSQADWVRMEAEAARRGMSVKDYKRAEVEAAAGGAQVPAVATPPPPPAPIQPPQPTAVAPPEVAASTSLTDEEYEALRKAREEARAKQDAEEAAELERIAKEHKERYDQQNAEVETEKAASTSLTDEEYQAGRKAREAAAAQAAAEEAAELERIAKEHEDRFKQQNAEVEADDAATAEVPTLEPAPQTPPAQAQVPTLELAPQTEEEKLQSEIARREAHNPQPGSAMGKRLAELKEELAALQKKSAAEVEADKAQTEAFDPVALAKKRIEQEQRRRQVEEEYRKLNPQPPRSTIDNVLEGLEAMRGSVGAIGGTFGRMLGAVLDVSAHVRRIRAQAASAAESAPPATVPTAAPPVAQIAPQAPSAVPLGAGGTPPAAVPVAAGTAPNAPVAKLAPAAPTAQAIPQAVPVPKPAAAAGGGLAAAAPYVAIGAVVIGAVKTLVDALNRTAEKYGEYNPLIAQAQAQAEIRKMLGDMRRASESGPELAKFIKEQSEIQQKFEDIKIKALMAITPVLNEILEAVNWILGEVTGQMEFQEVEDPATVILHRDREREIREGLGGIELFR